MISFSLEVFQLFLCFSWITILSIDPQYTPVFHSTKASHILTKQFWMYLSEYFFFYFWSSENLNIKPPIFNLSLWFETLLYMAWGTIKDSKSMPLGFSHTFLGVNWITNIEQVAKGKVPNGNASFMSPRMVSCMVANMLGTTISRKQLQNFSQFYPWRPGHCIKCAHVRRCCHFQHPANINWHLKRNLF